jgi:small GTP-binding protein
MPDDFQYDVFLSHSGKDKKVVRDIAERLKKDGVKVWFDEWALKPGDSIPAKMEEGLEHSRVLVLCMSANAFGSDWAQMESGTFRFRDPLNKERRFLPLRLDDAPIKGSLALFLYINWLPAEREQEYAKLLEACRQPAKPTVAEVETVREQVAERVIKLTPEEIFLTLAFSPDGKCALTGDAGKTVRLWDLKTGGCLRVLEGHDAEIRMVAWSADHRHAVSGGWDNTVRLWDVDLGRCLQVFEGHKSWVRSVTLGADGRRVLSGSHDKTVRLWDVDTGRCVRVFEGHTDNVQSVAWSADNRHVVSGAYDKTVRLWVVETGHCLRVLEGQGGNIETVAWSADNRLVLSGSNDNAVRVWEVETGRCLRVLEGHGGGVLSVAWSADNRLVLSGSGDNTGRVWEVETGRCLRVLKGHAASVRTVAWSADGRHAFSGDSKGGIRMWDLSEFVTEAQAPKVTVPATPLAPEQVQYTNAKVLLVGDTGVGKSGLAERLVNKTFVTTKSSHARKALVLESTSVPDNTVTLYRETMLWDLAGQPAYRLVHQFSMEDATVACVLFDNRSETNPFEGASYWSQALDQARTATNLKKILVASRIDVGGLPASKDRIEAFAREQGFDAFVPTSAFTGEGCDDLRELIRQSIPWDDLPKVTTEGPLAPLRAYVAGLKGEKGDREPIAQKLLTVAILQEGFCSHYGRKIPLDEFLSHLGRLEDTDAVDLLVFRSTGESPMPQTLVLLDPTRVDSYASALLIAAKDEPDGPGHLLESRVRDGQFRLVDEERIGDPESEKHVLWFVIENLLIRDLALRERIKGEEYIVFPSQCTAELKFPDATSFGVAFRFGGAVRSIYATLIAQLAHFDGFKKREFFHDAASYLPDEGGRCIVRLRDEGRGRGELELSFDLETAAAVRQGFIEFVRKHVESKSTPGSVAKRHAHYCSSPTCRKPFTDEVVRSRLETKKKHLVCPFCDAKTPLLDLFAAPTRATETVAARINADATIGRKRMTAGLVIESKKAEGKYDVFLSHNSKDKAAVEKIAKRLLKVGIRPWLDKWDLSPGDTLSDALAMAIKKIPCAALFVGPSDIGKWHVIEIRGYLERWASGSARMIPVILPGVSDTPELPPFLGQVLWVDMKEWEDDGNDGFYRIVCGILGRAPGDSPPRRFGPGDVVEWQEGK